MHYLQSDGYPQQRQQQEIEQQRSESNQQGVPNLIHQIEQQQGVECIDVQQQQQRCIRQQSWHGQYEQDIEQQLMMIVQKQIQYNQEYQQNVNQYVVENDQQQLYGEGNHNNKQVDYQMLRTEDNNNIMFSQHQHQQSQKQSTSNQQSQKQSTSILGQQQYRDNQTQQSINQFKQQQNVVSQFIKKILTIQTNGKINNNQTQHHHYCQNISQIYRINHQKSRLTQSQTQRLKQIQRQKLSLKLKQTKQLHFTFINKIIQFLLSLTIIITNCIQSYIHKIYFLNYVQQKVIDLNKLIFTLLIDYRVLQMMEKVIYKKIYLQWMGGVFNILNDEKVKQNNNKGQQKCFKEQQKQLIIEQDQDKQVVKQIRIIDRIRQLIAFIINRLFVLSLFNIFNMNKNILSDNNKSINNIESNIQQKRTNYIKGNIKRNELLLECVIEKQVFIQTVVTSIVSLIRWIMGLLSMMLTITTIQQYIYGEQITVIDDDNLLQSTVNNNRQDNNILSYIFVAIMGISLFLMIIIVIGKLLSTLINTVIFFILLYRNKSNNYNNSNDQINNTNVRGSKIQQLNRFVNFIILCGYQQLHDIKCENMSQNNMKRQQQQNNSLFNRQFKSEYQGLQQIVNRLLKYHNRISKPKDIDNQQQQLQYQELLSLQQIKQVTQMIIKSYNHSYINKLNPILTSINQFINIYSKYNHQGQQHKQQKESNDNQQSHTVSELKIGSLHCIMLLKKMAKLFNQHKYIFINHYKQLLTDILNMNNIKYYQHQFVYDRLEEINYTFRSLQLLQSYYNQYNRIVRQFIQQCHKILLINGIQSSYQEQEQHKIRHENNNKCVDTTLDNSNNSSLQLNDKQPQLFISLSQYSELINTVITQIGQQKENNNSQKDSIKLSSQVRKTNNDKNNNNNKISLIQQVRFTNQLLQFYHIFLFIAKLKLNSMIEQYITQSVNHNHEQTHYYCQQHTNKQEQLLQITNFISYIEQSLSLKVFLLKSKLSTINNKQFTTFKIANQYQGIQQLNHIDKQSQSQFIIKDNHLLINIKQVNSSKHTQISRYLKISNTQKHNQQISSYKSQQQSLHHKQNQQQVVYQEFVKSQTILQTLDTLIERLVQKQNLLNNNQNNYNQPIDHLKQHSSSYYQYDRYQSSSQQNQQNQLSSQSSQQQDYTDTQLTKTSKSNIFSRTQFSFNFNLQQQMSQLFTQIKSNNNNNNNQQSINQIKQYQ